MDTVFSGVKTNKMGWNFTATPALKAAQLGSGAVMALKPHSRVAVTDLYVYVLGGLWLWEGAGYGCRARG